MLEGKNLHKSYGDAKILNGIDIKIEPGTITTVIGPSGCGKTTLLRALALLSPPCSGEVCIDDRIFEFPGAASEKISMVWPEVTVVFQQLFMWPHLTLRENAMLPLQSRGVDGAHKVVEDLITELGVIEFADRYPNEVSVGQRQLGALVRALALEPKYLLLDEVTSALDVEYIALVLGRLKKLRDCGVGILIVSHLLQFARNSADQVVFLVGGEVVERGPAPILDNPSTKRLAGFLGRVVEAENGDYSSSVII